MDSSTDFYQILGVLPDAEQIVITAAYRALASRYHPDRWAGDKTEATRRMSEINAAYDAVGTPEKRASYDRLRSTTTSTFGENSEQVDAAFDDAMSDLETRWQTAVSLMPDLQKIRDHLAKTAHRLAFAFVVIMLESKKFPQRVEIAQHLEVNFLERYFGSDREIIIFAKDLIAIGNKQAIQALNNYIDVVGSEVPAQIIIRKITDQFQLRVYKTKQIDGEPLRKLKENAGRWGDLESSLALIRASGLEYNELGGSLFKNPNYEILRKDSALGKSDVLLPATNAIDLISWVQRNLC
jgi:curved DNA-binding protein CbpA